MDISSFSQDQFIISYTLLVSDSTSEAKAHEFADIVARAPDEEELCPDIIELEIKYEQGLKKTQINSKTVSHAQGVTFTGRCLLHPIRQGEELGFVVQRGDRLWPMGDIGAETCRLHSSITQRNEWNGWPLPQRIEQPLDSSLRPEPLRATEFCIFTSQEMDALHRAQCDGKTLRNYTRDRQYGQLVYMRDNASHRIELALTETERTAGVALEHLENLVQAQDADAVLATSYILGVLAPPPHLPAR